MSDIDAALAALTPASRILVYTGAGISTESGIPDFRGPNGLWKTLDPDRFRYERYLADPGIRREAWRAHRERTGLGAARDVYPNSGHYAVTALWGLGRLAGCVTQNVDGLHQAAGLPDDVVAELHGSMQRCHCLGCDGAWPTEEVLTWPGDEPRRPDCGGIVKTTTVMFGEYLPAEEMAKAYELAARADAVLAVGTTLAVYPAAEVPLSVVARGAPLVIVNVGPTEADPLATVKIEAPAGETLTTLVAALDPAP